MEPEMLGAITVVATAVVGAIYKLAGMRKKSIEMLRASLKGTWSNQGDLEVQDTPYFTLSISERARDLWGELESPKRDRKLSANIDVRWGYARVSLSDVGIRGRPEEVAVARVRLRGNRNRLAWAMRWNLPSIVLPTEAVLLLLEDLPASDGSIAKGVDRQTFTAFHRLVPPTVFDYLRGRNFDGFSFRSSELYPLSSYVAKADSVAFEFDDPALESCRRSFLGAARAFLGLLAVNTWTIPGKAELSMVPTEWEGGNSTSASSRSRSTDPCRSGRS